MRSDGMQGIGEPRRPASGPAPCVAGDARRGGLFYGTVALVALAVLVLAVSCLGMALDEDAYIYLQWGRELVRGERLNQISHTAPKPLMIAVGVVAHLVPGGRGPELFYSYLTAVVGAVLVALLSRLAERLGGLLAAGLTVALVLGNMTFIRYVLDGQSTLYASVFIAAALLFVTRAEAQGRDYTLAGVMVLLAGLARSEAAALGPAVGLLALVRLGWRGWRVAVVAGAIGASAALITILVYGAGFGSFSYMYEVSLRDVVENRYEVPSPFLGFAKQTARAVFYQASRSWLILLLSAVGAGVALSRGLRSRFLALLLFPAATLAFMWLMVVRGMIFNVRCTHSTGLLLAVLASAGLARLAVWAAQSGQFLEVLVPRYRAAAFVGLSVLFLAPSFVSRPLPTERQRFYRQLDGAMEFLRARAQAEGKPARMVLWELHYALYHLDLSPASEFIAFRHRVVRPEQTTPPWDAPWNVVVMGPGAQPLPTQWGGKLVWEDPTRQTRIYRCEPRGGPSTGGHSASSTPRRQ